MNYALKKLAVDGLLKVVDSSPTKLCNNNWGSITKEQFDIWIKYALSTLDIISDTIGSYTYIAVKQKIQEIASQNTNDYPSKTFAVVQILLDLAESLINTL
ncbi:hypothetical protein B5F17_12500 [Butyricicoccus pullicaecorum]|uniref:Uncharacterized protein n=1 Tax=Butyricicoccus pullicaecorum TaxID=501571 RepID=A0A1Y4L9S8_9FIRM|nr:hypothetical protein [Butyricicoccus pullicaecorum]OUP51541.1 hypothetical protein B5F17_12500 [Butyricicoccus pullicaecorum]